MFGGERGGIGLVEIFYDSCFGGWFSKLSMEIENAFYLFVADNSGCSQIVGSRKADQTDGDGL